MLNHSRVYKLKQLEIALEISLRDLEEMKSIIESAIDKLVEMNRADMIDSFQAADIFCPEAPASRLHQLTTTNVN